MDPIQILGGASPTRNVLHQTLGAVKRGQGLARAIPISYALRQQIQHSGVVKNGQEFPHFDGWVQVKKFVRENKIWIGTRNIGSLTEKTNETSRYND